LLNIDYGRKIERHSITTIIIIIIITYSNTGSKFITLVVLSASGATAYGTMAPHKFVYCIIIIIIIIIII